MKPVYLSQPQDDAWPAGGLERAEACPACRCRRRDLLYEDLTDRVFRCAPGTWILYRCGDCRSAYLDPRPTPDSIALAYSTYFTHGEIPELQVSSGSLLKFMKTGIRNDYVKTRFGGDPVPRIPLGRFAAHLFPFRRLRWEWSFRHLPTPRPGAKLLDLGCGNGAFVRYASVLGWDSHGIDPDVEAVAAAQSMGLKVVRGGFPDTGLPDGEFDAVTVSHVIEHTHDPIAALREVHRILKPGGRLWVATPNLEGAGHRMFHRDWIGLDPPRHLMIFNSSSLLRMCEYAGFPNASLRRQDPLSLWIFLSSLKIQREQDPMCLQGDVLPSSFARRARWANLKAILSPRTGEELILTAEKPS